VLYVGGCGRSGSTLLDRILGQVPGLWSIGEVVHIWRRGVRGNQLCGCGEAFLSCPFWTKVGELAFGGWDRIDVEEMLALQRAVDRNRFIPNMLVRPLSRSYAAKLDRYADVLARLYTAIGAASGAAMIVDSTKHASYAYLLRRVPGVDLRVIHLVRDARGVAYSWTKEVRKPEIVDHEEYMPRYHPARMACRWVAYNLLFHLLHLVGVPTTSLRYERLIEEPRARVDAILRWAALDHDPGALAFIDDDAVTLEPTHTVAGNPMRFTQGRLELRRDEKWRDALDPRAQRVVGTLTWPLMRAYGYRSGRG
jgi:hypothetical protein